MALGAACSENPGTGNSPGTGGLATVDGTNGSGQSSTQISSSGSQATTTGTPAATSESGSSNTASPLKRFYMHAGFSRFIRPGATFVDVNHPDMVAAVSADGKSLAIVVRNADANASRGFTFDLTKLPTVGPNSDAYRTSQTENLAPLAALAINDYRLVVEIPPYSVTTFVLPMP